MPDPHRKTYWHFFWFLFMIKGIVLFFFSFAPSLLFAQVALTIEGAEVIDTVTGTSDGISIPRKTPTFLIYRNNSITSVNSIGYMLQAGDEIPGFSNNNLDGAVITGNRFIWNGKDESSMTHALFTGYNVNVVIKYNYLNNTPNGIQRKSNGMTDVSGIVAYNIIKNPKVGIVAKGMNGVKIFNNTLFCELTPTQTTRGLIDIHTNFDGGLSAVSVGTKVFNNIFYTRNGTLNIKIYETSCLSGFESDYNLFWCESGEPMFEIGGNKITLTEWQALGYDLHSVVQNPEFNNFTDFVPGMRLDYGKNLGAAVQTGLAVDAIWSKTDPRTTKQTGVWQVGARIYDTSNTGAKITIYPNPASDFFYVSMNDLNLSYQTLKIYSSGGCILFMDAIERGSNIIEIPEYFTSGVYNVALEAENLKRYFLKLIVVK